MGHAKWGILVLKPAGPRLLGEVVDSGSACCGESVLGSRVGLRGLFHLPLFLTAPRMVLPQNPGTEASRAATAGDVPYNIRREGGYSLVVLEGR